MTGGTGDLTVCDAHPENLPQKGTFRPFCSGLEIEDGLIQASVGIDQIDPRSLSALANGGQTARVLPIPGFSCRVGNPPERRQGKSRHDPNDRDDYEHLD
jgi:hypothetical protein